jgi:hypothetical protein
MSMLNELTWFVVLAIAVWGLAGTLTAFLIGALIRVGRGKKVQCPTCMGTGSVPDGVDEKGRPTQKMCPRCQGKKEI